jgi:hypothetical protein
MKKFKTYVWSLIAISGLFFSCSDYLETVPDNRATLDSPEKVSELLVSAYPDATHMNFTETMTDNAGDKEKGDYIQDRLENSEAFFWKDHTTVEHGTPTFYWNACYKAIAHANEALKVIEEVDDPANYSAQKGEALLARAYSHFMLVNLFAKHYDPATASSDLGVPLVTEPETTVFKTYKRATVEEIYTSLEQDIVEGIKLIKDDVYSVPKYHFTKAAAHAFASRFYLYKGEWDKVIEHANFVLGANPASKLRDWNGVYQSYTVNEMGAAYTKADEPANLLLSSTHSLWARGYIVYRYALVNDIKEELFDSPINAFSLGYRVVGSETLFHIHKYEEYFKRVGGANANVGYPMLMAPLFVMEEVLFNRAEAQVMKGDYASALLDLDAFYSKRSTNYDPSNPIDEEEIRSIYEDDTTQLTAHYPIAEEKMDYLKFILDWRRRDFIHSGMRWFDIRRFHMPVVHKTFNGNELVLQGNDARKVLQIPSSAIAAGITPNSR